MASQELTYDARCPNAHVTRLTFRPTDLREQLARGTLVLYCSICDTARAPSAAEQQELARLLR